MTKTMKKILAYGIIGWLAYEVGTFVIFALVPFIIYKLSRQYVKLWALCVFRNAGLYMKLYVPLWIAVVAVYAALAAGCWFGSGL